MTLGMIENRRAARTRGYAGLISFERQKFDLCHRSITAKSLKSNWEWNGREANSNTRAGVDYKLNKSCFHNRMRFLCSRHGDSQTSSFIVLCVM